MAASRAELEDAFATVLSSGRFIGGLLLVLQRPDLLLQRTVAFIELGQIERPQRRGITLNLQQLTFERQAFIRDGGCTGGVLGRANELGKGRGQLDQGNIGRAASLGGQVLRFDERPPFS